MGETLTLYNLTKKEALYFVHVGGSKPREIAGGQDTSAIVTWYLIKNRGDMITFVGDYDYDDTNDLPMGITWDEVKDWPDRTDAVVNALIENEILQDCGRLYEDEDDPENIYIRDLRNCWDMRPPKNESVAK